MQFVNATLACSLVSTQYLILPKTCGKQICNTFLSNQYNIGKMQNVFRLSSVQKSLKEFGTITRRIPLVMEFMTQRARDSFISDKETHSRYFYIYIPQQYNHPRKRGEAVERRGAFFPLEPSNNVFVLPAPAAAQNDGSVAPAVAPHCCCCFFQIHIGGD